MAKKHPSLISRKGENLAIRLLAGQTKNIKDTDINGDNVQRISFVEYFPAIQYGLLHIQFYEGSTYDLISIRTGNRTNVGGDAILSPDNRRLAIFHADISAGYAPNVLTVLLVTPSGLIQEFNENPDLWGPDELQWKDNKTILFDTQSWKSGNEIINAQKILRFQGRNIEEKGKWSIESN